jgi:hypothetical protein
MHDIIGNTVAFFFGQLLTKAPDKFARASQRECDSETQNVPTASRNENI